MAGLKKKSLPKAPKMNASKESWDKYDKKVVEIKKFNDGVEKETKRREAIKAKAKK